MSVPAVINASRRNAHDANVWSSRICMKVVLIAHDSGAPDCRKVRVWPTVQIGNDKRGCGQLRIAGTLKVCSGRIAEREADFSVLLPTERHGMRDKVTFRRVVFGTSGPHCTSSRSLHVRVVSTTGLFIIAEMMLPSRVSTTSFTSKVSFPVSALKLSPSLETWTKLFCLAEADSCIHLAGCST